MGIRQGFVQSSASSPHRVTRGNGLFLVILPGLKGGGRNLTGLRDYIGNRGWVLASLSTRVGLKRGIYNLRTHYKNLAQELINQSQGRVIRIYAHSLGGIEVLDLMKELAQNKDLPGKSLEIIFISPPGIGQRGLSGLLEVGRRLIRVIKNIGLYDLNYLLPHPAYEDTPVHPQRQVFLEEWLPRLVTDVDKRAKLKQAIETIDSQRLLFLDNSRMPSNQEQEALYLRQRHKLLKHLVEKIVNGQHIVDEKHQQYSKKHKELALDVAPVLIFLFTSFIFTLKVLYNLYRGIDRKILDVCDYCQQQEIDTKLGVVILGRDDLVQYQDYTNFKKMAAVRHIPIHNYIFDNEEHSSVVHKWDLIDALEELELK